MVLGSRLILGLNFSSSLRVCLKVSTEFQPSLLLAILQSRIADGRALLQHSVMSRHALWGLSKPKASSGQSLPHASHPSPTPIAWCCWDRQSMVSREEKLCPFK